MYDVLVIGAGPAGIACAYFLQQAGIAYKVVDRAHVIGSTWADQYPSLRLNTTRFFSHLPGEKFPLRYGVFPTGKQYHEYLVNYVRKHNLNVQLGVEVYRVLPYDGGWCVESSAGTSWHPAVIVATGRFSKPHIPPLPGIERFTGHVLHSSAFKNPDDFAGQRVMVVGNGPSGVDLAVALPGSARLPVYLAQRTGLVLRPRYPWGLPKQVWIMLCEWLPERIAQPLLQKINSLKFEHLDAIGIKTPPPEKEHLAGGTRGAELIHAVRAGHVRPVEMPVDFDGHTALLSDGNRVEIDVLMLATGFRPALDCLDINYEVDDRGWPLREPLDCPVDLSYTPTPGYAVKGHPGLYVVGIFYQGKGAMYNFNLEAEIAVRQVSEYLAEPSQQLALT